MVRGYTHRAGPSTQVKDSMSYLAWSTFIRDAQGRLLLCVFGRARIVPASVHLPRVEARIKWIFRGCFFAWVADFVLLLRVYGSLAQPLGKTDD